MQKYQEGLEESMRGSKFIFDSIDLFYYNLQKTSLNRQGSSYTDSPKWLMNPKNNDNDCFQLLTMIANSCINLSKH